MPFLIILSLLFSLTVLYFIICLVIFIMAFARRKDYDWLSTKSLQKTPWRDFADKIPSNYAWLKANNAKDFEITTFDGLKLKGKWVETKNAKGTIIICHGYRGNYIGDYGIVFEAYKNFGFNLLMFRHRAHGESQGSFITFGAKEHKDLLSIIKYHNETFGDIPLFVSGLSMGASTVLYIVDKDLPKNVKGVTADSSFTSPYDIVLKVINDRLKINSEFLMFGVNFWCKLLAEFDLKEYSSENTTKNAKVPILFIHGGADDFVPKEMTIKAYNACATDKELLIIDGAGHGLGYIVEPEKVTLALTKFFNKYLNK